MIALSVLAVGVRALTGVKWKEAVWCGLAGLRAVHDGLADSLGLPAQGNK